jgi:hypothetical protein
MPTGPRKQKPNAHADTNARVGVGSTPVAPNDPACNRMRLRCKLFCCPTCLQSTLRGRWWWRWLSMTAMAAGTTGTHVRAPGPAGAHARGKWSTREGRPLPRPGRGAVGTAGALGAVRTEHAVVVMAVGVVMSGDRSAGEEDNRHHENDAGNDHHPRRYLIQAGMRCCKWGRSWMWRRRRAGRRRLDWGLGCLGHVLIMPRHGPTIN